MDTVQDKPPETTEPDRTTKDFTLQDMEWARREGRQQGIRDALDIIEFGGTPQLVRERLLSEDPS